MSATTMSRWLFVLVTSGVMTQIQAMTIESSDRVMIPANGPISRRNVVAAAASGVLTASSLNSFVSGVSVGASTFKAYQVEPDSGAELNPTLIELSVSVFVYGIRRQRSRTHFFCCF
jgi:hypothetical protein